MGRPLLSLARFIVGFFDYDGRFVCSPAFIVGFFNVAALHHGSHPKQKKGSCQRWQDSII